MKKRCWFVVHNNHRSIQVFSGLRAPQLRICPRPCPISGVRAKIIILLLYRTWYWASIILNVWKVIAKSFLNIESLKSWFWFFKTKKLEILFAGLTTQSWVGCWYIFGYLNIWSSFQRSFTKFFKNNKKNSHKKGIFDQLVFTKVFNIS